MFRRGTLIGRDGGTRKHLAEYESSTGFCIYIMEILRSLESIAAFIFRIRYCLLEYWAVFGMGSSYTGSQGDMGRRSVGRGPHYARVGSGAWPGKVPRITRTNTQYGVI